MGPVFKLLITKASTILFFFPPSIPRPFLSPN